MNTKRSLKWSLLGAVVGCGLVALPACELIVDFDRSKIPDDAEVGDVTLSDGGTAEETSTTGDSMAPDGGVDSTVTGMDGATEAESADGEADGGQDVVTTTPDTGAAETGTVQDTGTGTETGGGTVDAAPEAGSDASTDTDAGSGADTGSGADGSTDGSTDGPVDSASND